METRIPIDNLESIQEAAKAFVDAIGVSRVIAFHGTMGAGKTTFIKAICKELGVTDTVASPTFAIINEYQSPRYGTIYHFDLYRLETLHDVLNIGAEDYFYSGNYCFIEWPELAESLLPGDTLHVHVTVTADGSREVIL